jgi:LAO/AO transport system kinase
MKKRDKHTHEDSAAYRSATDTTGQNSSGTTKIQPAVDVPVPSTLPRKRKRERSVEEHVDGILKRDRVALAQTITLIESMKPEHNETALHVLERIMPHTGASIRVGITGSPGVGKSTFIEAFGTALIERGQRVAVLAIDPSSQISRGSILGDKTRMEKLSVQPGAFIRPSPSAGSLGGVARKTREAMLVCEAAGFDVILIETVGVGQSETVVRSMVDFFLLLMLAGAGDQLQGIKRGIVELADAIVITKADGDNITHALLAKHEYETALHLLLPASQDWTPPVRTCSALNLEGIPGLWDMILDFRERMMRNGFLPRRRMEQAVAWMHDTIRQTLEERFSADPAVTSLLPKLARDVEAGVIPALTAAQQLLDTFFENS